MAWIRCTQFATTELINDTSLHRKTGSACTQGVDTMYAIRHNRTNQRYQLTPLNRLCLHSVRISAHYHQTAIRPLAARRAWIRCTLFATTNRFSDTSLHSKTAPGRYRPMYAPHGSSVSRWNSSSFLSRSIITGRRRGSSARLLTSSGSCSRSYSS
jgi:hypothetical protein